jgi:ABC-type transporter Mla maintaining outer membrane lipid asymmetry permease subunit MlaE
LATLLREARRAVDEQAPASKSAAPAFRRFAAAAGVKVAAFLNGTSQVAEQTLLLPWSLLPRWPSAFWGLRSVLHYLRLTADPSAWLYVAVAGAIAGFVATYFTFRFLPYRQYTEPLVIENLLHALGFALYRILVPVLATVLIAARCGAAVASDVGGKAYGQQLAALRSFGVGPERYLRTGILYAFLLGTPILILISFLAAKWTSLLVFTATHPDLGAYFWRSQFHRELTEPGQWLYRGSGWLAAKTLCCAAGIALVAYERGRRDKHSTRDVSAGITSTILWSTLYVLAVHFAFAFFEFE